MYIITNTSLTAASEVSSILESRISGSAVGGNVEETGRVLSMSGRTLHGHCSRSDKFYQVSVMVLDVFGVLGTCRVRSRRVFIALSLDL